MKIKQPMNKNLPITDNALFESAFWEEERVYSKFEAWSDLVRSTRIKRTLSFGNKIINVNEGELVTSFRSLAERWHWSIKKVSVFLDLLVCSSMIEKDSSNTTGKTFIRICNGIETDIALTTEMADKEINQIPTSTTLINCQVQAKSYDNDHNIDTIRKRHAVNNDRDIEQIEKCFQPKDENESDINNETIMPHEPERSNLQTKTYIHRNSGSDNIDDREVTIWKRPAVNDSKEIKELEKRLQPKNEKELGVSMETALQRNEKETKKAKEVFPPAPPIQEKEINKEKEKKNNVFFPLASEKCVFDAASGEKNAQSQNEMKNNFSNQNLSSELENKFETSTQNFSTTTHQNKKNDFEIQKKFDSLTAREKFSQSENFSEKEKSCGKKEKEVLNGDLRVKTLKAPNNSNHFTQKAPVESWKVRLQKIKTSLLNSEWIERVAMQFEIPHSQIQPIFENFCCEIEASNEHSNSLTPVADIQKHFYYWTRLKKEKLMNRQQNDVASMYEYYTELEKQVTQKHYGKSN
ncbi:MAG: hypothetical protein LBO06_00330 [Bacteroidales bacterium]|jgi:hypothetical protein|nr:hypothetical protein [Bacteroidales bacterium]